MPSWNNHYLSKYNRGLQISNVADCGLLKTKCGNSFNVIGKPSPVKKNLKHDLKFCS